MAHFYGSMQGARGETTRTGTKSSGIHAHVRGWGLGVLTELEDSPEGIVAFVKFTGGSDDPGGRTYGFSAEDLEGLRNGTLRLEIKKAGEV